MDLLPFDDYVRSLNRKRMSAGVVFSDAAQRVLLVEPSYKPHWDLPGGAVDAEEAPWTTAAREVREELGIDRPPGRLLVIDYLSSDDRMPEGLAFIFDGGTITGTQVDGLSITDPEILSAGLYTLDEAATKIKPSLALRLAVALNTGPDAGPALCENGKRVAG